MPGKYSRNYRFTKQLEEIVSTNMSNNRFGVSELADKMNMSRSNLHRKIKSATGDSVSQYLRKVRLNKAKELLKEQSFTISEVAFAVGFGSVNYFSNCFKEHFGYTPSEVEKYTEDDENDQTLPGNKNLLKNFPARTTTFIGREKEIKTITDLINEYRIVSLVGTGGCGKTRLACQVLTKLEKKYNDGIWFVNLATVESEELVAKQLLNTLEIAEVAGKTIEEILLESIKSKELLILLDNCEHLLSVCAELTTKLIRETPGLSIITTSRKALYVNGEKIWLIPPLSLVEPSKISNLDYANKSEAVRLFTNRALLNNHGFKLTNENSKEVALICHKVDGIPLAVELVASRTKYMDIKTMISRFDGRLAEIPSMDMQTVERHKTLEATIEWSYNLLNEEEKTLFRCLSVFAGEFDLDAVEEVCSKELIPKGKILDLLSNLIDTNLVQTVYTEDRKMRYFLLETLRQYGTKILTEKKEREEISRKHLEYFTLLSEKAYDERMSSQAYWMNKMQMEHSNILAGLRWAENHKPEQFQRFAANLSWFWGRSNDYSMAIEILEKVINSEIKDEETQARLNTGYGSLLTTSGDSQRAQSLFKHGLKLWHKLKNKKEEALLLAALADLLYMVEDNEAAMKFAEQGYSLAVELNDSAVEIYCTLVVTFGLVCEKNIAKARPLTKKALKLAEEFENLYLVFASHHLLGDCALINGNYLESEKEYAKGLETTLKYGDTSSAVTELVGVAMSVAGQGRHAKALRLNAAATSLAKSFGCIVPEEFTLTFWKEQIQLLIVETRKKLGEELTNQYEEEGRVMSFDETVKYALNVEIE